MTKPTFATIDPSALIDVSGGASTRCNCAQNACTGHVDHSHGFDKVTRGGRWTVATPNGFAGRSVSSHGRAIKVYSDQSAIPL
jgi:hypothetical protein